MHLGFFINKIMHYRKLYEKELVIFLNKDFHVHHLDFNRKNNDISNLVAISSKHHAELHYLNHEYNKAIEMIDELSYLFGTERANCITAISHWIDFKGNTLKLYIDKRNEILRNKKHE